MRRISQQVAALPLLTRRCHPSASLATAAELLPNRAAARHVAPPSLSFARLAPCPFSSHPVRWSHAAAAPASHPADPDLAHVSTPSAPTLPPATVSHGILSRPLLWSELHAAIIGRHWGYLGRLEDVQRAYGAHRQRIAKFYPSMSDFILEHVFGLDGENAIDGASGDSRSPRLVWTPNAFPYAVEAGVRHDLLWSDVELDDARLRDEIEARLPQKYYERVFFVNPTALRTVKDVYHAHVFWRVRADVDAASLPAMAEYGPRRDLEQMLARRGANGDSKHAA